MLLAQRGFRVQVSEKQDVIGGRNAEVRLGDYRFDLGPTFLMMKFLLDDLFIEGGRPIWRIRPRNAPRRSRTLVYARLPACFSFSGILRGNAG
jgi:monoamine oxidase